MKAFSFNGTNAVAADGHRGSAMKMEMFPYVKTQSGVNIHISIGGLPAGRFSPEHRHNFDQVRLLLSGRSDYGGWIMEEGDCGYFPESVFYGPQTQEEDARILTLQFPGDSAAYYPTAEEVAATTRKLKEADQDFGRGGTGTDANGESRDAFELVWEELQGKPIGYAPPRYGSPVIIKPDHFRWKNDKYGREIRHLGRFGDSRLTISNVRLSNGDLLGPQDADDAMAGEFWFLIKGRATIDGHQFAHHSGFFFDGEQAVAPDHVEAEFLVVRFPDRVQSS